MPTWPEKVVDGFLSKTGEKIADFMGYHLEMIIGFESKLQHLKRNSEQLSCVASDIGTAVEYEERRGVKRRKTEVKRWLESQEKVQGDASALEHEIQERGIISRFTSAFRVEGLIGKMEKLIQEGKQFGELVLDAHEARGEPLLTERMFSETFGGNLEQIWNCLAVSNVPIVGIYGMAGVGKTEWAKHIHNQVLERTQDRVYWVEVSKNISIKQLQDSISHAIGLTLSGETCEDIRAARLKRALIQRKKFVLILDNLGENINLERVGYPLGEDGCQLIITTRFLRVCDGVRCQQRFEVNPLDENEAWKLFEEKFGRETVFPPQVEEIAKSVVRRNNGLPRGIIQLAIRMRGVTDDLEWSNECIEEWEST